MKNLNLIYFFPEIILFITIIIYLIINIIFNKKKKINYYLSIFSLLICLIFTIKYNLNNKIIYLFNKTFIKNKISNFLNIFIYLINLLIILYSYQYFNIKIKKKKKYLKKEFFFFILTSIIGQTIIVSSNNLLIIYLGIELTSLSISSLLISESKKKKSYETSIKYFILNIIASGFFLYGISMIYGATKFINLNDIYYSLISGNFFFNLLILGIIFILSSIFFKFGIAPFHMWIPDIYEGSICPITMLISSTPKIVFFSIILKIFYYFFPIIINFKKILIFISILSIIIGSTAAIMQKNIKRLLAYSSIFHSGFILLGITSTIFCRNSIEFINSFCFSLFYIIIYVINNLGILGITIILSKNKYESNNIRNFNGLKKKNFLLTLITLILILSLSGIPPLIGFYTKFSILKIIIKLNQKYIAILISIFSLINIFYLLIIIKNILFKKPIINTKIKNNFLIKILLIINIIFILFISIFPDFLINICFNIIIKTFTKIKYLLI
ncbi:NADH-quinone oxidoreductase subunit NuoN [Candidatus Zinderia endosymbiont of Aphrophora alni]|uniref:NADH-quinone oxidoreductase subunit N n=1 Tax=Candidatus Zinderia endosymbiont of Aphrophora alni TaxID=3077951 RepID=UPI0030D1169C